MAAKKKEIRKVAPPRVGFGRQAEDRQPLRAREGQEDAADRRLAGRSGEGAGAPAARRSAGDQRCVMILVDRRTARRQAESRDVGNDRRRAAARAGDRRRRSPSLVPGARLERRRRRARRGAGAGGRHRSRHAALEPYTPDGFTAALQAAIAQLSPSHRAAAAHLPDARLRAEARRAAGPRAHHRRHRASRAAAARPPSCGRCSRAS